MFGLETAEVTDTVKTTQLSHSNHLHTGISPSKKWASMISLLHLLTSQRLLDKRLTT